MVALKARPDPDRSTVVRSPAHSRRRRRWRRAVPDLTAAGVLSVGLIFILFPFIWLASTAFKQPVDAFATPPTVTFTPTLDNFRTLFTGPFLDNTVHSLVLMVLSTMVALVLGVPAGYAFARGRVSGRRSISAWLVICYITPPVVFIIPMFVVFLRLGLIDSYVGLVLSYQTGLLPFTIWMSRSYFLDVPTALDEAAMTDGCSRFGAFIRVVLPVAMPGVVTIGTLVAIASWGEYFGALILSGPNTVTAPVAIFQYVGVTQHDWGAMAAGGLVIVLPVLVATVLLQRGLIRGLTAGAVQG